MTEQTRYVLDARADNYGWKSLDAAPDNIPVDVAGFEGADSVALSVPVQRTPPHVLNRVNWWLSVPLPEAPDDAAAYFLQPLGVRDGQAFLAVRQNGAAASAKGALRRIAEGLQQADPRTQALLHLFLVEASSRVHEVSPTEVLESVKSSFAVESPLSVKSSFSGASRSALTFVMPPALPADTDESSDRVVVAIPDTGIGTHPWLPVGTWVDAERNLGWSPPSAVALPHPDESDATPADGLLDVFAGHGTFVAGLVRQLAPGARLLSLHSMAGDGTQPGERVLNGLEWIRDRVATGDPGTFVDVICLACGYYEPSPGSDDHTARLANLLGELGDLGVQVVVAAGNDATESPTFPGAFARLGSADTSPQTPLLAVGAVNPNGSRAEFSNRGDWVVAWQPGVALVSTVPTAFGVPADPTDTSPFDPSNLIGGFAQWSGSSFAAGVLAGRLAAALQSTRSTIADVHERTRAARESLGIRP